MSGTLLPIVTGVPAGNHQNLKISYRENFKDVYRSVPGFDEIY